MRGISIIIPSYCPGSYIWECLDSINNQTLNKELYEVLIVLNGCYEPYYSKILAYIEKNKETTWKLVHTDIGGVSNARNIGIEAAKFDNILFIDDDDLISMNYLESMLSIQDDNITPISRIEAFIDKTDIKPIHWGVSFFEKHKENEIINPLKARPFMSTPCLKLLTKSQIRDRRFDERFKNGEDALFVFSISDKIKRFKISNPSCIYYRRIRENSADTRKRSRKEKMVNGLNLCKAYSKIYFSHPFEYSFKLYITRVLATIRIAIL